MQEKWKPLVYRGEYFGDLYEVSDKGMIRNLKTGKCRSLNTNHEGYLYCVISRGRKRKVAVKVHRAVAENYVDGDKALSVDHIDGNKLNNSCENLEFVTTLENNRRAARKGLIGTYKFSEDDRKRIKQDYENGVPISWLARQYNVHSVTVWRMVTGRSYIAIDE